MPATLDLLEKVQMATECAKRELVGRFYQRANDFFTEADLAAFLAHRLHVNFEPLGFAHGLVHLQYPTPFRCSMEGRVFKAKSESDVGLNSKKYRRGAFDVVVLHPGFAKEFEGNFRLSKGQRWDELQPVLEQRDASSEPVALTIFELMYNRDPLWADQARERGAATMDKIAVEAQLDFDKVRHALRASSSGFKFAVRGEMLVFDNGLNESAALALQEFLDEEIQLFSAAIGPLVDLGADMRIWKDLDAAVRMSAASLERDVIPESAGVYAWFREGARMYVGKAASLRDRLWSNHLGNGNSLKGSALRRNVAEHLRFGSAGAIKKGDLVLSAVQLREVRAWLRSCDVAWLTCASAAHALALETRLKVEFKPSSPRLETQ